jgi:DeoR family deoxyribose operon repressor
VTVFTLPVNPAQHIAMAKQASGQESPIIPRVARLERLRAMVSRAGVVRLNDAARELAVSSMTVRRDLAVATGGLVYLGGYIVSGDHLGEPASYHLDDQIGINPREKMAAACHAARLVAAGDTIFVDVGSTTPHLINHLPDGVDLTIVCYSMNVARLAAQRPNTQLFLLGGLYHASSDSFSSPGSLAELGQIGICKAFISAGGVELRGASCSNFHEVAIKRAVLASSRQSYLIVDGSKFGRPQPAFFAKLQQLDRIITDGSVVPAVRRAFARAGVRLDVAK